VALPSGTEYWVAGAVADEEWIEVAADADATELESEGSALPLGGSGAAAYWQIPREERRGDGAYALDGISRFLVRGDTQLACRSHGLFSYFGKQLRFGGAVVIHPAFRDRLERFEQIVSEVAQATYGRRPLLIRHRGAFACRSRRGQPSWLSEHALGNAIDVAGFEFGPALAGAEAVPEGTPASAFSVSVARHWRSSNENATEERHARFLVSLITQLVARGDVFRGIITPADAAHEDHFHFDMAPRSHIQL
jgi:hypothetical protein